MKSLLLPIILGGLLCCSCATQQKTFQPPDATRLKASTARVSKAVDAAHASANAAREATKAVHSDIDTARKRQKEIAAEVRKLKDVPASLVQKINEQDATLESAANHQGELEQHQVALEKHFVEADQAKAQVEVDKTDYFGNAQGLADAATNERSQRVAVEKKLSWYRWHWWGSWIVLGAGIVVCALVAFLKFTGRLALKL